MSERMHPDDLLILAAAAQMHGIRQKAPVRAEQIAKWALEDARALIRAAERGP